MTEEYKDVYTPTKARENFFKIMNQVNEEKHPVTVSSTKKDSDNDIVIMSKDDYNAMQETLYLTNTEVTEILAKRKNDKELDFDDVWKSL
ncbi:type II toxin-antitoxin system Phd/YefM family antitoxin [Companilactobacillus ginsenosidimutans]|uniref:Antitoxin n=1 Tax=Companilactobacillus ginsenosidimutans TaxID=1007676 RepID=A0A0H4QLQ4_9LACO|nr:type II toxin-antitoxin system prevent-host-death family antitoxin [Companilactobacillus ginsenosidimutans]AKP67623.1 hypothetical protein ABM34_08820 [Companilactobacillus ginsenosidimutans]